ncbi:MAG: alginate export family protein [Bacteroidales bacterium]|nr:alginate export family protein [Bacteroidales bacterium]MCF8345241.1 alginate export family protein [Bacteroidales bacterium]MCF8352059.1 alginate export family protein [Bacteroidales bacterium]MCF8377502.1 alginate export family protein [Bacteroidales bacterium]MCF8401625.1 alginate export family protein [Bacteroidales bacterium]
MFRFFCFSLFVLSLICSNKVYSQFLLKAELRPRAEFRHGYKKLAEENAEPAIFVSQRSRLMFYYQSKSLDAGFSIQDVRVWGDEGLYSSTGVFGDHASIDANEAWIGLKPFTNFYIKIGRQYFDYDSKHLLWNRNWNQHSLSYDALLLQYEMKKTSIDLAFSLNNKRENIFENYFEAQKIKTMNFLHIEQDLSNRLSGSLMFMLTGYTPSDSSSIIFSRGTYGLYFNYRHPNVQAELAGYYQNGKNRHGTEVQAHFLFSRIDYLTGVFRFGAGYTVISGNKINTARDNLFDIFYGARHRYYGLMDYFSNIPAGTSNSGLQDLMLTASVFPFKNTSLSIDYHLFSTQQTLVLLPGHSDPAEMKGALGSEFDFHFSVDFRSDINLRGGYSLMFPTDNLRQIQGIQQDETGLSYWGWLMLTVKPTLFSSE